MQKVSRYQRRSPDTSPRSAANTPLWQVNDDAISTSVTGTDCHRFSSVGGGGHAPPACARAVKYIANSPAKNISTLESHTMVPTLTMLGRFSECTRDVMVVPEDPTALVTSASMTLCSCRTPPGADNSCELAPSVRSGAAFPGGFGGVKAACDDRRVVEPGGETQPIAQIAQWRQVLGGLASGADLPRGQAAWAMEQIMTGIATSAQIAAFGVAMQMKGPTAAEVGELADVMLAHGRKVPTEEIGTDTVDVVGTGGDGANTGNLYTMAAIWVSAAGVPVSKHGSMADTRRGG